MAPVSRVAARFQPIHRRPALTMIRKHLRHGPKARYGWVANPYRKPLPTSSRQGLTPCKMRRALLGAITAELCGAALCVRTSDWFGLSEPSKVIFASIMPVRIIYNICLCLTIHSINTFLLLNFRNLDNAQDWFELFFPQLLLFQRLGF